LSRREYSARALSDKLLEIGYEREAVEAAVVSMQEYGFQSDERFAEMRVRHDGRRMGNRRVAASLVERGIAKDLASEKLATLAPEAERAVELVQRFRAELLDDRRKAKIWRFMAYRGFSSDAIKAALRSLAEAAQQADTYAPD
jgi:regulatory protein